MMILHIKRTQVCSRSCGSVRILWTVFWVICTALIKFSICKIHLGDFTNSSQKVKVAVMISVSGRNQVVMPAFDIAWRKNAELYPYIDFVRMTIESPLEHAGDCDYFVSQIGDRLGQYFGMSKTEEDQYLCFLMMTYGCTAGVKEQAAFAREWSSLMVSSGGMGSALSDKTIYPTLIRFTAALTEEYAICYKKLLEYYKWTHVTMLCDADDQINTAVDVWIPQECPDFRTAMYILKAESGYHVTDLVVNLTDPDSRVQSLIKARGYSSVIVIMAHMDKVRATLLTAWDLGMINNNFVYISFAPFPDDALSRGKWGWQRNDSHDETARLAYQSLLFVSLSRLRATPETHSFFAEIENVSRQMYNITANLNNQQDQRSAVNCFLNAQTTAQIVDEAIRSRRDCEDGLALYQRMVNGSYRSFDNTLVHINSNGDKNDVYAIWGYVNGSDNLEEIFLYDSYNNSIFPVNDVQWIRSGSIPSSQPLCEYAAGSANCQQNRGAPNVLQICLYVVIPLIAVTAAATGGFLRYRHVKSKASQAWLLPHTEINYRSPSDSHFRRSSVGKDNTKPAVVRLQSRKYSTSRTVAESERRKEHLVIFKGNPVWIKSYNYSQTGSKLNPSKHEQQQLYHRKHIAHQNIVQFYGVVMHASHFEIVMELAVKGSLQDFYHMETTHAKIEIKYSFINDLVKGLSFIHSSTFNIHGHLSSRNCLIDKYLTLKLSDFGLDCITNNAKKMNAEESHVARLLYLAPEILRSGSTKVTTKAAEIYTFAILLHQILFECRPFGLTFPYHDSTASDDEHMDEFSVSTLVNVTVEKIKSFHVPPCRPFIPDGCPKGLKALMDSCWTDAPQTRPSMLTINKIILTIPGLQKPISYTQAIMDRLESFADELAHEVHHRTQEYIDEKKKADDILHEIIPKSIVDKLHRGEDVPPEVFDEVTIGFTAITNFPVILSTSQPLEVGAFLNAAFNLLDSIIRMFNVYKVETIADTYMVVSGLPDRNGHQHSAEISRMALCMLERCEQLCLRAGKQHGSLLLKIGMHSGSCAAAIIGTKMPRYCLFGDTVNTASRMVSFGEALKVHVSADSMQHISAHHAGKFVLTERGVLQIKGKGDMVTYWLSVHQWSSDSGR
ncbi:atrial natriuretic peptide receptor 2-like [Paramacrobiotus metropolitanus]|uniref:atrial natriuretic peptide receptor 2-like n=1 Tax=Paramacrobiotus metropolitanus TaxID=2943436 RepID=UPI00244615CF|nr:atrial natriuretic peptide receptor 2-like [Paramacrobiotus metropolitanus]